MTLSEIKEQVMFQTNNDADDLGDYEPHINDYVNEGYERLVFAYAHAHVDPSSADYPPLEDGSDEPNLPEWTHRALTDWATWFIYRNGNPQKPQRGMAFRSSFDEILMRVASTGGIDGVNEDGSVKRYNKFKNIPR